MATEGIILSRTLPPTARGTVSGQVVTVTVTITVQMVVRVPVAHVYVVTPVQAPYTPGIRGL